MIRYLTSVFLFFSTFSALTAEEKSATPEIVVALIGDSTVTDQSGWGKAFAERLDDEVLVKNFSAGGRSSKSFHDQGRFEPVLELKPDFLFIQFGHNGQPGKGPERETKPDTTYREWLKYYIDQARGMGAKPVIISSVTRRDFTREGKIRLERLPGYVPAEGEKVTLPLKAWAEAAKEVAEEQKVPFIDLYFASVALHNRIGPEESMTFNPKEGDISHFNEKGAKAIADLIIDQLPATVPDLAAHVKKAE